MILLSLAYAAARPADAEALRGGSAVPGDARCCCRSAFPRPARSSCIPRSSRPRARHPTTAEMPVRVFTNPDTPVPEVQLLSNGRYHVMVTNAGGGYSRWKDLAVTRWREDATCDNWGTFCYIRDVASGEFWSTAHQPTLQARAIATRRSSPKARAEFRRRDMDFETHTEIVVSPEDDIELRRVRITNRSRTRRDDRRHELRRSGARAAGRGRAASGVQQSLRADRDRAASGRRSCARAGRARPARSRRGCSTCMAVHGAGAGRSLVRDRPHALHRPRPHGRGAAGDGRLRRCSRAARARCSIRSSRSATGSRSSRSKPAIVDMRLGHRRHARRCVEPRRQVPGSPPRRSRVRARVDAQPGRAAADQCDRIRRAALRAARGLRHLRQCRRCAPTPAFSLQQPPRAVGPVELRDLRRPADRAAADRRLGEHRSRAPARAGARVLAPEGAGRRPRDLERGSRAATGSCCRTRSWG